jgi:hypothetical protein
VEEVLQRGGQCCACAGPDELAAWITRLAPTALLSRDAHTVLSHPEVDVLVLADTLPFRSELLMHAVQLERAVLVVHPADLQAERFYVVQLALEERRFPVWPMMPHRFVAGLTQLRDWLQELDEQPTWQLEATISLGADESLATTSSEAHPLWFWADWLRLMGGEVTEVYAVAETPRLQSANIPLTLTGRWERGGHFVTRFARNLAEGFVLQSSRGVIRWQGPLLAPGPYRLERQIGNQTDGCQGSQESVWRNYADWLLRGRPLAALPAQWSDAVATAEIVQAVEESLQTRKTVPLWHQEYNESTVYKSRAATLGCGMVWMMLVLAMISPLVPQVLYLIPVLLVVCLALFALGWLALRR